MRKTYYELCCANNHSGQQHRYKKKNLEMATKALEVYGEAKSPFTRSYCLPAHLEVTEVVTRRVDEPGLWDPAIGGFDE